MTERRGIDLFGAVALTGFALLLGLNQVVIKVTGGGFGPVFQAGLRSAGAVIVLYIWMKARGIPLHLPAHTRVWGVLAGVFFTVEFICLFVALDRITVARSSIIFYSMPVWLALASHFLLPNERLTAIRMLGMALAMGGVVLALANRAAGADLLGDLLALGAALLWAGIALLIRATPLAEVRPEMQLFVQVVVSAVLLLALAPMMGDLIREPTALHIAGLLFQIVCIASLGFLFWFWLMTIYKAGTVASFSFLSPVFAVLLGWLLLREQIDAQVWVALGLVAAGLILINRR